MIVLMESHEGLSAQNRWASGRRLSSGILNNRETTFQKLELFLSERGKTEAGPIAETS
jgi:hypothetical protein